MPGVLRGAIRAALTAPGKRMRALLLLATAESFGCDPRKVIDAAAGFELIHGASLVLDDLPAMDDAQLRRGMPTLHRAWGEDIAILSAVAMLNHAYGLVASAHDTLRPRRWSSHAVLQRVVEAVGWNGTVGGQAVDLHSEGRPLEFETLEYIHSRKTGALFVAASAVGSMLANASEGAVRSLEAYAKNLGLAFQITDDILDETGTIEALGKDVGKDAGKLTFVRLAGLEGAAQLNGELIEAALEAIRPMGRKGEALQQLALMVRDRRK